MYLSERYPKMVTLWPPQKNSSSRNQDWLRGEILFAMYWSKWESFYASSIQLLKFSTFTGIFENHLRFDVSPQPQFGVRFYTKNGHKRFFRTFCTKMTTKDFFNFFNLRWPLKTHYIYRLFFKKFIDFLLFFFIFSSQKCYWFLLIFFLSIFVFENIASQP